MNKEKQIKKEFDDNYKRERTVLINSIIKSIKEL
jgi:hypothetical protein